MFGEAGPVPRPGARSPSRSFGIPYRCCDTAGLPVVVRWHANGVWRPDRTGLTETGNAKRVPGCGLMDFRQSR
jgi:hypothetical protein